MPNLGGWGGGVEAFFGISAFFLVKKHYGNNAFDFQKQFKRRVLRLYPPYLAVLFVAVLYAFLLKVIPGDFLSHLFSVQNFYWMVADYKSLMQPITAHTWTLSIEVWSGIVWLILLKRLPKKRFRYTMLVMLTVGILYRVLMIVHGASIWIISLCPVAHFDAFALGSFLAIEYNDNRLIKERRILWLLAGIGVVGIIAVVAMLANKNNTSLAKGYKLLSDSVYYLDNWFTGNIYVFISLLTFAVVGLLVFRDEGRKRESIFIEKALLFLGDNSYVMYLFHWPIRTVIRIFIKAWIPQFLLVFISSVIATFIFNKFYFATINRFLGREVI